MTVILGPTPCATCRQPVTVVRRDVVLPCTVCGHDLDGPCGRVAHTHTLPDVGPFTTVDDDGTRHECCEHQFVRWDHEPPRASDVCIRCGVRAFV